MSNRTRASGLAVVVLLALVLVMVRSPVPYVAVAPGPTVDILGANGQDEPVVRVEGRRTYPTTGEIRLVTVSVDGPDATKHLPGALREWLDPQVALLPKEAYYPEPSDRDQQRAVSAAQMVGSQDSAVAAALTRLGYDLRSYAEVLGVSPEGPSDGLLEPRDRLLALDGERTRDVAGVFDAMAGREPGERLELTVRRGSEVTTVDVTTGADPEDPERAVLGILPGTGYVFPFEVEVGLDPGIGGPSAGLMFALSIYDTLTPGSLTGGAVIAGTGTITAAGRVGPIGGVQQKIAGAAASGAELFFVPRADCADATRAPVEEDRIRLVRADTLRSAIRSLQAYVADPGAALPRCEP